MKKPILGRQTFLSENTENILSYEKFVSESNQRRNEEKPLYTGRYFVVLTTDKTFDDVKEIFRNKLGFTVASSTDFTTEAIRESTIESADAIIYEDLGIALVGGDDAQIQILEASTNGFIIEPERIVYVPEEVPAVMNATSTWGLDATQVTKSQYTGKGVKVAVLDTGFDVNHPDFVGRSITTKSFVPNETIDDLHGHGTHCIGTACGNTDMNQLRYGVAKESSIYACKVLSNGGSGVEQWIVEAIYWAADNGCKVISMSLGSRVFPGQSYYNIYEKAAQYALSKGCIVVAAAGNDSTRSMNSFWPVSSPADCPSILAVGALDMNLNVSNYSNRTINPNGQVDIVSAGDMVHSSWPMPRRYRTISGTSMATPHVAGILALLWEKYPNATPYQIINELRTLTRRLPLNSIDVGLGLSIAP